MLRFTSGNILDSDAEALVNTVNTVGVMGKGVALLFKNNFPRNFDVYRRACLDGSMVPGRLLVVRENTLHRGEKIIINFPTKKDWKNKSEYAYIEAGLVALADYILKSKLNSLAIPALGCGNGGLDWNVVRKMIDKHLGRLSMEISVYEPAEWHEAQKQRPEFKVIIAADKDFTDYEMLKGKVDRMIESKWKDHHIEVVCTSEQDAERFGVRYAKDHGFKIRVFETDSFVKYAEANGNRKMVEYADAGIFFWDGHSKDMRELIALAKENKLLLRVVRYDIDLEKDQDLKIRR